MIYTAKRSCLILKALSTVQRSIFCYNYICSTSLHVLYVIYESQQRSEHSCQCWMIFEQSHYIELQPPLTKHILFSSHHGRSRTLRGVSLGNTWSDFEFSS